MIRKQRLKLLEDFLEVMLGLDIQRGSICRFCVGIRIVICIIFLFLLIINDLERGREDQFRSENKELK